MEADGIELDGKAASDGRLDAVPAIALVCKPWQFVDWGRVYQADGA
jgi:hypothetical protein